MAISFNFVCFLIITTFFMFNLAKVNPDNHNQDDEGPCNSTQHIELDTPKNIWSRSRRIVKENCVELVHGHNATTRPPANTSSNLSFFINSGGARNYREGLRLVLTRNNSLSTPTTRATEFPLVVKLSLGIAVFICATAIILSLVFVVFNFFCKRKRPNEGVDRTEEEGLTETFESCSPRQFSFKELSKATNNFRQDQVLGVGGFGTVYRALLPNGRVVAVKRVSSTSEQGIREYKAEVTTTSKTNHKHLVQLIGWCHEIKGELLLVYELVENKTLDTHLFNSEIPPLAWDVRYKIAQGLAKALRYLHEECAQSILHMDIKSDNVLLDYNFEPKLGDFGLAKLVDYGTSIEFPVLTGTRGYVAPECVLYGTSTTHSDVYSYGVVALELATGRRTIDPNVEDDKKVLVRWMQNLYKAGNVLEGADPKLGDDYDELQMKGLMVIGLWCVLHDFHKRPSIKEVVRVLDNTDDPLSDLHGTLPCLAPDSVTHDFDLILGNPSRSSDLIIPMEMETPKSVDLVVLSSSGSARLQGYTYSSLFVWRHIRVLHLLRYLMGISWWFRSSHNG
ncbi:L-type lectin-domain containing receptor kinase IX.1-like protein [Tanacetum coccineum]